MSATPKIGFNLFDLQRLEPKIPLELAVTFVGMPVRWFWRVAHGDVNVFEDLFWCDAENTIVGFDQIVAFAAAVLPAEMIGEAEVRAKLFGFDQEAGAIRFPFH
jgi:hypothetical protein